jgi:5-methylcytosine-specific restriction endonuclease McrA
MAQRSAARLGVTVDEYWQRRLSAKWFQLLQHQTDRILANERIYEHAERRAKRDDCSDEEKRAEVSADMLRRYHADPSNWSTARKRRRIFERDNWRCRACGKKVTDKVGACHPRRAVAGHILAKATGGRWTNENMATLCYPCNVKDGVNQLPIQIKLVT